MYAVIETGGKQYRVSVGDVIFVEKLGAEADSAITFDKVVALTKEDNSFVAGTPFVDGVTVSAKVLKTESPRKSPFSPTNLKKDSKRKMGHRQPYTQVRIEAINA